jgi:hypothetical protein
MILTPLAKFTLVLFEAEKLVKEFGPACAELLDSVMGTAVYDLSPDYNVAEYNVCTHSFRGLTVLACGSSRCP